MISLGQKEVYKFRPVFMLKIDPPPNKPILNILATYCKYLEGVTYIRILD